MEEVDEDELKTQIFEEVGLALLFEDALSERDGMIGMTMTSGVGSWTEVRV